MTQTQTTSKDDKKLYRVVDWTADNMFVDTFVQDLWLTHSEVTMLLLQGKEVKLIQTR